ncbi:MAG: nitrile hydratase accessory protein [Betaproteobacteria bacterium]|nr:nitrile hydratase accessory protein [Betaproteobacteria bacterium]
MTSDPRSVVDDALAAIPEGERGRTFEEPWQAQAFAITLALHRRGVFTWNEWAETLGGEIKAAQAHGDPDDGHTYYHHWLRAIERLVEEKGISTRATLARYRDAWDRAADRTPHGAPIVLEPKDFG